MLGVNTGDEMSLIWAYILGVNTGDIQNVKLGSLKDVNDNELVSCENAID